MKEVENLLKLKQELIETVQKIITFDTVEVLNDGKTPFGKGNADCLDYVLDKCQSLGFTTYNCDYYAGHADYGEGKEIFGILGHVDVVPANEKTWIAPPFEGRIIDNVIYGRGILDDKGPMIACMYAVKALAMSGYKFKRKVRLIFGCNEETGMKCMEHYFQKVSAPTLAISPDADFPIINREKGIMAIEVNCGKLNENIIDINAGLRRNIVPDECSAIVKKGSYNFGNQIEVKDNGETIVLHTNGKGAHGSTPSKGDNAAWKMFSGLLNVFPTDKALKYAVEKICDYTGKKWGVNLSDKESGELTLNVGVVRVVNGELILTLDIRHPVTYTCEQVEELFNKVSGEVKIDVTHKSQPLFVREDSYLVQSLLNAYHTSTGKPAYTVAIGGGTYSRCIDNCVGFGPEFPDEEGLIHQPNESMSIDRLMEITKIYMETIKEICCE